MLPLQTGLFAIPRAPPSGPRLRIRPLVWPYCPESSADLEGEQQVERPLERAEPAVLDQQRQLQCGKRGSPQPDQRVRPPCSPRQRGNDRAKDDEVGA